MAYITQLPSGRWAASVRTPSGTNIARAFDSKISAQKWAGRQEQSIQVVEARWPGSGS